MCYTLDMKNTLLKIYRLYQDNAIDWVFIVSDYEFYNADRETTFYKRMLLREAMSIFLFEFYSSFIPEKWIK